VKKLGRFLIFGIGIAVGITGISLIGVNLYVQSQGTQIKIQQELSRRLGTTLKLRRISVTPWAGLKLSGITIPQSDPGSSGNFLEAKTFRLRVQFSSLFSEHLVITQVSLVNPNVVWAQNAQGQWRLPSMPPETVTSSASPPAETARPSAAESLGTPPSNIVLHSPKNQVESIPVTRPPREEADKNVSFKPEIRRVDLKDGNFHFLDASGKVVAKFEGVDFHSSFRTATAIKGNASIEKTSLRDKFFLEGLQSPLHYDPNELEFTQISARAAGGELSGRFQLRTQATDSPFTAHAKFRDLQADQLVKNAGGPVGMVQGRLEGFLDATGKTADPNALSGTGEIHLRDGQVQQYSLLVALGQILQIDELTQLHLEQAQVKYHISPGLVIIDELLLRSPNIRLSATGTITFAGKLHLESQLALNDKVRNRLFSPLRENFQPISEPGYAAVNFQVSGTLDRPKTNLMDKIVGRDLRDLGGVINSLFGSHKKEKKESEESSMSLAPATTPPAGGAPASPTPSASPNDTLAQPVATPTPWP
jgi:type II secretion system protein N